MYWLDGSSELPYTPKSSYLLSKTRTRAIALAQDLIENQARTVKSCVKYNNFHHWCTEASELVDLMIDLIRRDEKYLLRDGLSIPEESLCQILTLRSQYVNLVSISTFKNAIWCFYRKLPNLEAPTRSSSSSTTTTSSRTTPTPSYTTYKRVRSATPMGAALPPPHNRPVMVGTTNPPQPPTSRATECRVNDPLNTHPKEGEGKEGVGSRKKGGKEEFRGGEGKVEAKDRQVPGNNVRQQENHTCHR
jgi:hypothetical protein